MLKFGTTEIILVLAIFFLVTVPVIIVLGIIWRTYRDNRSQTNLKQCPFCAEKIQALAKVCRFCGRAIPM